MCRYRRRPLAGLIGVAQAPIFAASQTPSLFMDHGLFHPAVAAWFDKTFAAATPAQVDAWPLIRAGRHTLIAAPTGSGKTLAAFLAAIDDLVRLGLEHGLPDETRIVYVSPLKALSNDVQRNLEGPLAGIREELRSLGLADLDIRPWVRTGDTAPGERQRANRKPPHILVTTPESLYVLLGSESGRKMLATTRTVIVDEIHAVAPNKRGSHLALSLERLDALCGRKLQRVGLSATQNPIAEVARFLTGDPTGCAIVDSGHRRHRDLAIALPESPLESVMSHEVWEQVYGRLADLVRQHRTTLVFVNTRRLAERVTRHLSERLGSEHVRAHHGSLSRDQRFDAEQRLKAGQLKALIATASLELGIDIGDVDLVCQIGSPRSIASFLQRVGRSGHAVGATPKGRLFPLSRDELVESAALLDSVARGELDRLAIPEAPLDVLAQQLVAEVAAQEWAADDLLALMRRAWPYRALEQSDFDSVVAMLADGFSTRRGRRGALLHHDAVNGRLRGRRGARLTALTAGGTIPDNADYQVLLEPENHVIGSVNEDFAVESLAGDVFQLGNRSYRIQRVERGTVRVEDAQGAAPNIPFWLGEAPGRSDALSAAVSRLREEAARHLRKDPGGAALLGWLTDGLHMEEEAARQLTEYLAAGHAALGVLPTQSKVVVERFFDEAGGMQLVVHSPYGSRINRAWGLALRKRFCATFNFEIQAAATEDNIVISLTQAHSFALEEVPRYLHSNSARQVLIQAVLDSPMFTTRWRWVAGVSLALPRMRGGKKVPPQLARMAAEDLVGSVFPDQIACAENLPGDREIPDHPLVEQAIADCLGEAMDAAGFERVLTGIESGAIEVIARDLNQPSPLALEVLSARPYAFLDDAPLEERRTQAVMARRWLAPEQAADLGRLDAAAIERVRGEAWPDAETADELHDALCWLGFLTTEEAARQPGWKALLDALAADKRAALAGALWVAAERLPQLRAIRRDLTTAPPIEPPAAFDRQWSSDEALVEILRGRLEGLGPVTEQVLASPLLSAGLVSASDVEGALLALQREGFAMRGRFTSGANADEWCDRRLLARIHHYTIKRLRSEIEPVAARDFLRFLFRWQRVAPESQVAGVGSLDPVLAQLEGFGAAAAAWESEILPARLKDYRPSWLDQRCHAGHATWMRLRGRNAGATGRATTVRTTPITLVARRQARLWRSLATSSDMAKPGARAQAVVDYLAANGASFHEELLQHAGLLRSQLEEALAELVALGLVTSDGFAGLRALLVPPSERTGGRRRRRMVIGGLEEGGRWSLLAPPTATTTQPSADAVEHVARVLLRRWGVVFWRVLERESGTLPAWRDLLRVYRQLEASGEIRGGRFVAGFTGEQFALPEAVGLLREIRRRPAAGEWTAVSGADPLNLAGILTPGPRLPALAGNRLLIHDGVPAATLSGGEIRFVEALDAATEWFARKALVRRPGGVATDFGVAEHSPAPLAAEG
ncbi:MAG: DEAD/DEAH box helicase [Reyranella sp.]|uniref:DEAD/DEAH box helicase n=1 Tax=Reyranella sp. TaxID=1929291 RepID=UPI003D09BEAF